PARGVQDARLRIGLRPALGVDGAPGQDDAVVGAARRERVHGPVLRVLLARHRAPVRLDRRLAPAEVLVLAVCGEPVETLDGRSEPGAERLVELVAADSVGK